MRAKNLSQTVLGKASREIPDEQSISFELFLPISLLKLLDFLELELVLVQGHVQFLFNTLTVSHLLSPDNFVVQDVNSLPSGEIARFIGAIIKANEGEGSILVTLEADRLDLAEDAKLVSECLLRPRVGNVLHIQVVVHRDLVQVLLLVGERN